MDFATSNKIVSVIWGIADDMLRELFNHARQSTVWEKLEERPRRLQPLRTLDEIRADIVAFEEEAGGLLDEIIGGHA